MIVAVLAALLVLLAYSLGWNRRGGIGLKPFLLFVLLWSGIKFAFELWDGATISDAGMVAGVVAVRLAALLLLGLVLANGVSTRKVGLALSWALKPFAGKNAWQGALAFAIMLDMIPQTRRTLEQLKQAQQLRRVTLPVFKRLTVVPMALVRIMARSTWTRSVAIASRRLDRPEAWSGGLCWQSSDTAFLALFLVIVPVLAIY
ncbi:hypothetical protein [Salidesulfovibrio brasiliensis]|uniref:hypothetical protein n=1 Tax=Salidesulfovibrio brasiliensis TaxID=221711 RepID=UPI0012EEAE7A|nr:hypothetical protein [Salidesulfovibrio brasiliensis]